MKRRMIVGGAIVGAVVCRVGGAGRRARDHRSAERAEGQHREALVPRSRTRARRRPRTRSRSCFPPPERDPGRVGRSEARVEVHGRDADSSTKPIVTDDGTIDEVVSSITWTATHQADGDRRRTSSASSRSTPTASRKTPTSSCSKPCRPTPTAPSCAGSTRSPPAVRRPSTPRRSSQLTDGDGVARRRRPRDDRTGDAHQDDHRRSRRRPRTTTRARLASIGIVVGAVALAVRDRRAHAERRRA